MSVDVCRKDTKKIIASNKEILMQNKGNGTCLGIKYQVTEQQWQVMKCLSK